MAEVFAKRSDWLLYPAKMKHGDVLRVHPRDGLTTKMVIEALAAQKLLYTRPGQSDWWIVDHGTSMLIQRKGFALSAGQGEKR